ncbi:MAG: [LysW]-aminoadipate kinase [Chloroflexaceae bacterium]|nr:[LysW]-aminoadipate kinase [Chloroflexaceae bacterium]NJO05520.1 [LysW]-aminoadipate kinase [Chloroflexaceae bacterium]
MIVVKVGGGAGINYDMLCEDLAMLKRGGHEIILVHGGSDETNRLSEQLGYPARFVVSTSGHTSRYTDRQTLEIFMMATGKINGLLVENLQRLGINAIGVRGLDGQLLSGKRKAVLRIIEDGKQKVLRDDWTGTIDQVNTGLITLLLKGGYLPVVAPIACSFDGEAINVDGDRAAAAIASALGANTLLLLTNVPGLLRRFPDESTLITHIERGNLDAYMEIAQGRMKKKVMGAGEALEGGVGRVILADARRESPVSAALAGQGTVIE